MDRSRKQTEGFTGSPAKVEEFTVEQLQVSDDFCLYHLKSSEIINKKQL